MPGLSQLKKFSSDLLALGDEVSLRAGRGEKPVTVPIPEETKDLNDADDFILGLPDENDNSPSDVAGDELSEFDDSAAEADIEKYLEGNGENVDEPDLSSLLDSMGNNNSENQDIPDLSMFTDVPGEDSASESLKEPEQVSVADMSLDDLLSEGGFDENNLADDAVTDADSSFDNNIDNLYETEDANSSDDVKNNNDISDSSLEDLFYEPFNDNSKSVTNDNLAGAESDNGDSASVSDFSEKDNLDTDTGMDGDVFDIPDMPEDFDINNLEEPDSSSADNISNTSFSNQDAGDLSDSKDVTNEFFDETDPGENKAVEDLEDISFDNPVLNDTDLGEDKILSSDNNDSDIENSDSDTNYDADSDIEDFENNPLDEVSTEDLDERFSDSSDVEDLGSPFDNFSAEDESNNISDGPFESSGDSENVDLSDIPELSDSDFSADDDIPDFINSEAGDLSEKVNDLDMSGAGPAEGLDVDNLGDFDFDIPDTDSQLNAAENDDFSDSEFEIPGFSDVQTVNEQQNAKVESGDNKKLENNGKEEDNEESALPPNTLSDKQYKTFLQNLKEYPLNVRLAFEELLVKDEFTDDAEFEIIETILKKASARQVASKLEKMLDISIPVPRDYEHRSADEYESYKKSLSYQLRNRIIPIAIAGIVCVLVCIGLFNFGKNCIYKPLKANNLYKQGYTLLQKREYPLSEIKFTEATNYRMNKKWFFKYARGYRDHKQYQRAGKMYKNILYCFNHDKVAGLEYADMELEDLANYEKAEEIVRREVLDYHINDADGILKLGDIFLEWGTEKDPSKLEDARDQYATLLQLYGSNDLYMSRMMRYFIRTDNLREVLQLKQNFEPREESLGADDWTELSGYLLDKYYGELAPSEEYLRYEIEGLRNLLLRAVESNPDNPVALYNLARYFINTSETEHVESALQNSIEKFNSAKVLKNRDIYKYIDAYRLLGEHYINTEDFLQAQEQFAEGISLYIAERDNAGFKGSPDIGKLYEDMGDLKYSISGDYDDALLNYNQSISLGNDSPKIRYRVGYVDYNKKNYEEALRAFMKAGDGNIKERNLLLAMANTLSLRGDDYAAEGYYHQLIENIDSEIANRGIILPQANTKDYSLINTYLSASNNYGVTLYRLAKKTGDSSKNAEAIVQFSQSLRAWDALTRNPETMVRMEGSNLAEQNIKYITHPISEFEPAIYNNIPKTLIDTEKL